MPETEDSYVGGTSIEDELLAPVSAEGGPLSNVEMRVLGESVRGRPLTYALFGESFLHYGDSGNTTLIVAGIHGDEKQGVFIAKSLMVWLSDRPELFSSAERELAGARVVILPVVNPDGVVAGRRRNAHHVDLNRNFPASNWVPSPRRKRHYGGPEPASEPETQAVLNLVQRFKPHKIIAIHSISGGVECNNYDGPAEELAALMSRHNNYPVEPSIGYATPGSLGSWAGIERQIPTVTLELPDGRSAQHCWEANRDALLAAIAVRCAPAE